MNKYSLLFRIIFFLILFDFLFINFNVGVINITVLRLLLFFLFYIFILSFLAGKKFPIVKPIRLILCFFIFWLLYQVVSLLWISYVGLVYSGIYYLIVFSILIFITVVLINNMENVMNAEKTFIFIAVISIVVALAEFITGKHLPVSRFSDPTNVFYLSDYRAITGPFYNENDFSLFLSLLTPFLILKFMERKSLYIKIFYLVLFLASIIIIVINDAKLVLIAIALQIIGVVVIAKINVLRKIIFSIVIFLTALIVVNAELISSFTEAFYEIINGQGPNVVRLNLILNGILVVKSNLLGVGTGNYIHHISPDLFLGGIVNPHNWWVELLSEHGIIIFVSYLYMFLWLLKSLLSIYKEKTKISNIAFAVFLSLFGFIISSGAPSSLYFFWPMWLMIGVALAVINVSYLNKSSNSRSISKVQHK